MKKIKKAFGFINKKEVLQYFCVQCDRFLTDRYVEGECPHCGARGAKGDQCDKCGAWLEGGVLHNPLCKICGNSPEIRKSEQWFFRMDSLQPQLESWLDSKTYWKDNVINYCKGWFKQGLRDRPITRDLKWGVPVPLEDAKGKVIYVWFEAVIGYISSTREWAQKQGTPDLWKEYWMNPTTKLVHFIGKDNIIFHAILFPAMFMGHGDYSLVDDIPANEFLNLEGRKLSTSDNYAVWLDEFLDKFPPDPLRYYLNCIIPENKDSDFSWQEFKMRSNSELADTLGNFINRTLLFLKNNFNNTIPEPGGFQPVDNKMFANIQTGFRKSGEFLDSFQFRNAAFEMMKLARAANKYFNDEEPWITIKSSPERCRTTLYVCTQIVGNLALLFHPIMPFTSSTIWEMLRISERLENFGWGMLPEHILQPGHPAGTPKILFRKLQDDEIKPEIEKLEKISTAMEKSEEKSQEVPKEEGLISVEDFNRIEIRVARVLECEPVKGTKKLLKMKVDDGDDTRQIVAGIAHKYSPEQLTGKRVVVVVNLKPTKIRGVESQGMLLAATHGDKLVLLTTDEDIESGSSVS